MQITKIKKASKIVFPLAMLVLAITSCDSNNKAPNKHENDKTIITSCNDLSHAAVTTLTAQEQSDVCEIMVTDIKRQPPAYVLHDFLRLVGLVKETASDQTVNLIAMQAMDVVQTRQQETNDLAMQTTFDMLWQVYQGTQTQITFDDLNAALKKTDMAKNISDASLERLGINLWEQKLLARQKNAMNANKSFLSNHKAQAQ